MLSPYHGLSSDKWAAVTNNLIDKHPLNRSAIVDVVLASWQSIFDSSMGTSGFKIGKDIFPKPQIMGFFLHELIPLELSVRYPNDWRGDQISSEKDLVYVPDDSFSIEVKTSSNPSHIFGNRSYAQATTSGKKAKSGYYIAVNFEQCSKSKTRPDILLVRFGWLDSTDWIGQKSPTGQQSRLPPEVENNKLLTLYRRS